MVVLSTSCWLGRALPQISDCFLRIGDHQALAESIKSNGSLLVLSLEKNNINVCGAKVAGAARGVVFKGLE